MNALIDALQKWFAPRRRAERLIQERLDAQRDGRRLASSDEAWLDARVERDPELQSYAQEQASLQILLTRSRGAMAPAGFAARVVEAARVRPKESLPSLDSADVGSGHSTHTTPAAGARADESRPLWVWAASAAAVAMALAVVFTQVPGRIAPVPEVDVAVSGGAATGPGTGLTSPDFVVRASGVGPAKARVEIVSIVEAHHGHAVDDEGALHVRLPRSELVPVMQNLARIGTFKLTTVQPDPLPRDIETVILRFELD